MGFKFAYLCDLLSALEGNQFIKVSTEARNTNPDGRVVSQWFHQHGKRLRNKDTNQLALLSCMFPEKRTDRVYWLQDTSLTRVIGRCLLLGSSRREELDRWRTSGGIDLGQCVENVMCQAENQIPPGEDVTVEEIDAVLGAIASRCRFSGPQVRRQRAAVDVEEALSPLYRRLSSRDAKWLTRMILKSYAPVVLPGRFVLKSFHFLLPHLLLFQDCFETALKMLASDPISRFPPHPEAGLAKDLGYIALQYLNPVIGVKIGRPEYCKARSIKHCYQMVARRRMSVERKYDGEYCQIHIDATKSPASIQIFSKSGKDSSSDRAGINQVIRDSLGIGKPGCKFSRRCILEGEILVWGDKHGNIADFHKLRKFISRSGTFIGTESDSPPQPYEHLMVMFFDLLLLDDDICLRKPHRTRRLLLKDIISVIPGRADIAEQRVLDFSRPDAPSRLEGIFAKGVADRWEGFVLKGCEDPYFTIFSGQKNDTAGCWIKLKKDYIPGLGDTLDLAIIGGTYKSRDGAALNQTKRLKWTHFFIGCLVNKDEVLQSRAVPRFRVIDVIDQHSMSTKNIQILNQVGEYSVCNAESGHGFGIEYAQVNLPTMEVVYKTPFIVEMLGSGFEKPSGARFYTLRFPRILKIHSDRSYTDAVTFLELQRLAEDARAVPPEHFAEAEEWNSRLRGGRCSEYITDRSQSLVSTTNSSQSTRGTLERPDVSELTPNTTSSSDTQNFRRRSLNVSSLSHPVPIYVDTSMASSSSDEFQAQGNFLRNNDNLSSHSRKRKAPDHDPYVYKKHAKTSEPHANNDAIELKTSGLTGPSGSQQISSTTRQVGGTNSVLDPVKTSTKSLSIRSPLSTLPLYIVPSFRTGDHGAATGSPYTTSDPNHFLRTLDSKALLSHLKASNPHAVAKGLALGLVFTDNSETPLGPFLLGLISQISDSFERNPSEYRLNGKIYILSSKFLELDVFPNDLRLCLRDSWVSIGKEYFYATVSWSFKRSPLPSLREHEISCTPFSSNVEGTIRGSMNVLVPQVSIGFDRRELHSLGEFSSIRPLAHIDGGPCPDGVSYETLAVKKLHLK
ncbi:hypothetical protein FE257_003943 [Aspergillus nanangensis]|uniref:ATP-dependent DNA ligase family profile domain-containing protein n=1 Tax=Aspergillus nanangensis TaxID=2582783 RepID=A0AAD4GW36_ASPNN|nr:hypothetical protein FE257_003943 [Aspergillus nanangensis]